MFEPDPASVFPQYGRVEVDHSRKLVRRSIPNDWQWFKDFIKSDVYKNAVEAGMLPGAKLSSHETEGYFWIDVEYIDFMTRPNEWCGTQVVEALQMVARLQDMLMQHGYYIRYPHLLNVTFNPKPVMYDLSDIRNVCENRDSILIKDGAAPMHLKLKVKGWDKVLAKLKSLEKKDAKTIIKKAQPIYADLKPINVTGPWSDYTNRKAPPPGESFKPNFKVHKQKGDTLYDVLKERRPRTAIDFGSHRGYFSLMAASLGVKTLGMELCQDAVSEAYLTAKKRGDDCSFITINLLKMPAAMGVDGRQRHVTERIKAEMGFAPAIQHHLSRAGASFNDLAKMFNYFVEDWLMVEFVPPDDVHVKTWGMPASYNEDNFRKALGKYWKKIMKLPSGPSPRIWLICER